MNTHLDYATADLVDAVIQHLPGLSDDKMRTLDAAIRAAIWTAAKDVADEPDSCNACVAAGRAP